MAATARTVTRVGNVQNSGAVASSSSKIAFVKKCRGEKNFEAQTRHSVGVAYELKMRIYVRVWSRIFRMSSQLPMEKAVSEYHATEHCYEMTPYGKRYAVNHMGRDPDDYPMPLFTPEDQESLAAHIKEARQECAEKNECWDEAEHIEVEERWLHR